MITKINNTQIISNTNPATKKAPSFKGAGTVKFLDAFIKSQENLSSTRFIQGTMTNWFPKAVLSRSWVDFCEFSFLEFLESGLFYFAAPFFGEHLYRNRLFKSVQPKNLKNDITKNLSKSVEEIKKSRIDKSLQKRLITTKGGVLLGCLAVPALEYSIGFAKNLFTLKVFKVSNFDNVANLNHDKKEDKTQQQKVENHSKKVLMKVGLLIPAAIASGLALAKFGYKSNAAVKFSQVILEPGETISKLFKIKSEKANNFLKEYLKLDFVNNNGKLSLSKGQLAATCITGLFGYSAASKDRGKLDFYETWTRVPLVVLYTIFGSSLLDGGFKKYLAAKGKFPELIKRNQNGHIAAVPSRKDLPVIADKLAKINKTASDVELAKLIKQKALITGVPYAFSLLAMGFTLSAVSRIWTKYRYNHQAKNNSVNTQNDYVKFSPVFEGFKVSNRV
ncbi:MAG: hypothetical protein NC191_02200 [Muribaculaceae bacterium]|nr:hypothetical protein [Muribaculaceae bacterium]